jgi:hypothetical protein
MEEEKTTNHRRKVRILLSPIWNLDIWLMFRVVDYWILSHPIQSILSCRAVSVPTISTKYVGVRFAQIAPARRSCLALRNIHV